MCERIGWDEREFEKALQKEGIITFRYKDLPLSIKPSMSVFQRAKQYGIIRRVMINNKGLSVWRVRQKPIRVATV